MKALDIIRKYATWPDVLVLGELERLSNPEWFNKKDLEHEPREKDFAALHLLRELKCEVTTLVDAYPNIEGGWELVIDAGWLEHQLDIFGALKSASAAVAKGGCIFHLSPISMVNWGYWNINPKAFKEFYKDWEILEEWAVKKEHTVPLMYDRASIASEVSMYFVARKI